MWKICYLIWVDIRFVFFFVWIMNNMVGMVGMGGLVNVFMGMMNNGGFVF